MHAAPRFWEHTCISIPRTSPGAKLIKGCCVAGIPLLQGSPLFALNGQQFAFLAGQHPTLPCAHAARMDAAKLPVLSPPAT